MLNVCVFIVFGDFGFVCLVVCGFSFVMLTSGFVCRRFVISDTIFEFWVFRSFEFVYWFAYLFCF